MGDVPAAGTAVRATHVPGHEVQRAGRASLARVLPRRPVAGGMTGPVQPPIGIRVSIDIEYRPDRPTPYRARARWTNPETKRRESVSEAFLLEEDADAWAKRLKRSASRGLSPACATMTLGECGDDVWDLAMRGLEPKRLDPYRAGWRLRVVPTLGHIPVQTFTNGAADRAVHGWIADDCGLSTVKNSVAALVRVMDQAVRDGLVDVNPARVIGWQQQYKLAEDERDDPRSLALRDWDALEELATALDARSYNRFQGWGDIVKFAACTATRIGEVSGVRVQDVDCNTWTWELGRQTTQGPAV